VKGRTAKDVMKADVLSVPPDLTVHELAGFLVEHEISGAPVVDNRGRLVGVVSLTDIAENDALRADARTEEATQVGRERRGEDLAGLRVRVTDLRVEDIMTPTAYSVSPDTSVAELAQAMVAGRIHRLLVTDKGKLAGIVTSLDLLSLLVTPKPHRMAATRARHRKGRARPIGVPSRPVRADAPTPFEPWEWGERVRRVAARPSSRPKRP
jgi:CBS domain-containing protein